SLASSQRVASEFKIPKAYSNWKELLDDDEVDAVCIGTWPYMHRTLTLASLEKGKHVLCQARMANTEQEAKEMLAASERRPDIGSPYESMMRWLGRGNRVMAMAKIHVPFRRGPKGEPVSVSLPDHVDILYELANGAQVHMRMSETTGLSRGNQTWIHGSEGTI